jgi:hypothetical protein
MKEDARRIDDLMHLQVDPDFEAEIKEFVAQEIKEKMDDYIKTWNLLTYYFEKLNGMEQSPTVKEIHETLMQKKAPKIEVMTKSAEQLEQVLIEDLNVSPEEDVDSLKSLLRLYSNIIKRRGEIESQIVVATSKKESVPETEVRPTEEDNISQTTKNIIQMHDLLKEFKKDETVDNVLSCKKCGKNIPNLQYCPYCGNKINEEKPKPITVQQTANLEQLEKPKLTIIKIDDENKAQANQVTETTTSVKAAPQRLRTISEIITDLIISIGFVGLVSGIYIITQIQYSVNVSSDIIYNVVLSILDNLPGVPFSINIVKGYNVAIIGLYTILVGLTTLLIGYGLWKRTYRARVSSIMLYGFAIIADVFNITYYKLVNTPLGVFVSIIELSIIGVLSIGDFWK